MAILTRTRAANPLAEGSPTYSYHISGAGARFTVYLEDEPTSSGAARYYRLELTETEAKFLGQRLTDFSAFVQKESVEVST